MYKPALALLAELLAPLSVSPQYLLEPIQPLVGSDSVGVKTAVLVRTQLHTSNFVLIYTV